MCKVIQSSRRDFCTSPRHLSYLAKIQVASEPSKPSISFAHHTIYSQTVFQLQACSRTHRPTTHNHEVQLAFQTALKPPDQSSDILTFSIKTSQGDTCHPQ